MNIDKRSFFPKTQGYGIKLVVIVLVLILFIPPIAMVRNLIFERSQRSTSAVEEVIASWGGRLQITSPMVGIPYHYFVYTKNEDQETVRRKIEETLIILPSKFDLGIEAPVEKRNRGIYSIPVYTAPVTGTGIFVINEALESVRDDAVIEYDRAYAALSMSSLKGISAMSPLTWNRTETSFEPAVLPLQIYDGEIKAPVEIDSGGGSYSFSFELVAKGGGLIEHVPLARETTMRMSSGWVSPSFYGEFLPSVRDITDEGFTARWDISYLSRNLPGHFIAGEIDQYRFLNTRFGVRFMEPVSAYSLNERSIKYAWLFLLVPFITFFLFEVLQNMRIHPVQYLLAGAADIVFYLLLLSASEHISFNAAYLAAAAAVTLLLALYSGSILGKKQSGALMGIILSSGYLYLFVVLQSEDYALLYGSVGLFIILAVVMFVTRNVKWYRRPEKNQPGD